MTTMDHPTPAPQPTADDLEALAAIGRQMDLAIQPLIHAWLSARDAATAAATAVAALTEALDGTLEYLDRKGDTPNWVRDADMLNNARRTLRRYAPAGRN